MGNKKKPELSIGQLHTLLHQNIKRHSAWQPVCTRKRAIKKSLREIYPQMYSVFHDDIFELAAVDLEWFYTRQRQRHIVEALDERFCKNFHRRLLKIYDSVKAFRNACPTAYAENNRVWSLKQQAVYQLSSNESNACMDEWLDNMVLAKAIICSEVEEIKRTIEIEIGLV